MKMLTKEQLNKKKAVHIVMTKVQHTIKCCLPKEEMYQFSK